MPVPVPPSDNRKSSTAYRADRQSQCTLPFVDVLVAELAAILTAVMGEEPPITASTRLEFDLRLESFEMVALGERMRERWGDGADLATFCADLDIDQLIDLTVGDLASYVASRSGA